MNHNGAANWAALAAHPIRPDLETRPQAAGTRHHAAPALIYLACSANMNRGAKCYATTLL